MATGGDSHCLTCGSETTRQCSDCIDAPCYERIDGKEDSLFYYCSQECQAEDSAEHEADCKNMQRRRKLLRAARLLQRAVLVYFEVFYRGDHTEVSIEGSHLMINEEFREKNNPFGIPETFPTEEGLRNAALAADNCRAAAALACRLTRRLIGDMTEKLELVNMDVAKVQYRLLKQTPPPAHTLVRVSLASPDETWIIDMTGCQYGCTDVLVPNEEYLARHECTGITRPNIYCNGETADLDSKYEFATTKSFEIPANDVYFVEIERMARLHFADFVSTLEASLLDGDRAAFDQTLIDLENGLRAHLGNRSFGLGD